MSDEPTERILAAIANLRTEVIDWIATLRTEMADLRLQLMARMDRLQHRVDIIDEHLTMGLGHSDRVENQARAVAEDNRLLGEQVRSLIKIVRQLEGRINGLEDRS